MNMYLSKFHFQLIALNFVSKISKMKCFLKNISYKMKYTYIFI